MCHSTFSMTLEYDKTNWVDDSTRLNAENLNHIEVGIEDCVDAINALEDKVGEGASAVTIVRWDD